LTVKQGLFANAAKDKVVTKEAGGIKNESGNKLMSHHEFIFGKKQGLETDFVDVNSKRDFPTLS
jgi:hypothetical protein